MFMEDLPAAPIYFYTSLEMTSRRVRNIHKTALGWILFRNAEIVK